LTELLRGCILRILSPYKVVINLGRVNNVKLGMRFVIYEEGEMIKDLNGNDLEKLEITKGVVQVTNVQEKICVAESFHVEKKVYDPLAIMKSLYPSEVEVKVKDKLAEVPETAPESPPVKVGDWVRQVE
jgi:hypothetical protein